jgi:hypothetical protein
VAGEWRELHNDELHDLCCSLGEHMQGEEVSRACVADGK